MYLQGLAAILASLGFGILFNVRGKNLISAAITGGVGGFTYYLSLSLGYSEVISLFYGSIALSFLSEIFARIHKCPVSTFLLCALIPLVPGGGMYYTMLEIVKGSIDQAIIVGMNTLIQAMSIVIGCLTVTSFVKVLNQFKKAKL